jgi:PTS system nitrogen regulatory IIA component
MPVLRLADYLRDDLVIFDLQPLDKGELMRSFAAEVAARLPNVDEALLLERLNEREEQQSTGIGHGLALPHAMLPGLERTVVVVGRAGRGLDFAALDEQPVDLFFLLLSPPEGSRDHLRVLARLARILDNEETLARLRTAADAGELFAMLLAEDARHA